MPAKTLPNKFTVRVYGFLLNAKNEILLCEEKIGELEFTKFPGGGLEFGEGSRQCVEREFIEETGIEVFSGRLIYVNDVFTQSAIDPEEQVIGIYYEAKAKNEAQLTDIQIPEIKTQFRGKPHSLRHIWVPLKMLTPELLTFEMDRNALKAYLISKLAD